MLNYMHTENWGCLYTKETFITENRKRCIQVLIYLPLARCLQMKTVIECAGGIVFRFERSQLGLPPLIMAVVVGWILTSTPVAHVHSTCIELAFAR